MPNVPNIDQTFLDPRRVTEHLLDFAHAVGKAKAEMLISRGFDPLLPDVLPDLGLTAGDVGAKVHVYADGTAYEVEFVNIDGTTVAVETLPVDAVRAVKPNEIAHARAVAYSLNHRTFSCPLQRPSSSLALVMRPAEQLPDASRARATSLA